MRILIVEDSISARTMLKDMLALLNHEVVAEAEDKDDAIAAYRTHQPDLVTLDLGLGQEDTRVNRGLEVIDALRAADPKAKILVITANHGEPLRTRALSAGAYEFVGKPISIDHLRMVVARAATV